MFVVVRCDRGVLFCSLHSGKHNEHNESQVFANIYVVSVVVRGVLCVPFCSLLVDVNQINWPLENCV